MTGMSVFRAMLILGFGTLLVTSQSGCLLAAAAGAAGAGVAYAKGDLETSVNADPKQAADAAERAMKTLDIAVISKSASSVDGVVVGRTARDVKLTVTIKRHGDNLSKIYIRAGMFGNDAIQGNLLNEIREELGMPATAPVVH